MDIKDLELMSNVLTSLSVFAIGMNCSRNSDDNKFYRCLSKLFHTHNQKFRRQNDVSLMNQFHIACRLHCVRHYNCQSQQQTHVICS